MVEKRKSDFAAFLDGHVGRDLCVIVDGKLHGGAPIVAGLAQSLDKRGLSDDRAKEFAALLARGPLPCRLVREP